MGKYEITEEMKVVNGRELHRIKAVMAFADVEIGELGGFVENKDNLSQSGDAWVSGDADYIVFKNWWSSGRFFTWTRSNNLWHVGCFNGSGKELIAKAYEDSEVSGREYERIVRYVDEILNENK